MTGEGSSEREQLEYNINNYIAVHKWYRERGSNTTADDYKKLLQCQTKAVNSRHILKEKYNQSPIIDLDE
jgi:hypothetical protein